NASNAQPRPRRSRFLLSNHVLAPHASHTDCPDPRQIADYAPMIAECVRTVPPVRPAAEPGTLAHTDVVSRPRGNYQSERHEEGQSVSGNDSDHHVTLSGSPLRI